MGTMTPTLVKPCPTGAISDSVENLRKLSALRTDVSGQDGGNDASPLSCLCFRPPQSRRSPRKSAQKRPEILLRGRDAAPPRRRSHSGSQRRTWGFIGLCCQLSLHPPAFRFGNLPLVALLHDFIHGNYGVAQAAVFPDAVSHLYLRSLRNNEPASPFRERSPNVPFYSLLLPERNSVC